MYLWNGFGMFCVTRGEGPAEIVEVRAGSAEALDRLRATYPKLAFFEIVDTGDARFPVAVNAPLHLWSRIMEQLALDLDEPAAPVLLGAASVPRAA